MSVKKIAVIGGDRRFFYLAESLSMDGFSVSLFGNEGGETDIDAVLKDAEAAVLPFPISPDGVYLNAKEGGNVRLSYLFGKLNAHNVKQVFAGAVSDAVARLFSDYDISVYDYGRAEPVALKNALCTAEGALQIALENLPVTIHSTSVAVLGYGRIGRILAKELLSLGAHVNGVARKDEDLAKMQIDGVTPYRFTELCKAIEDVELIYNTVPFLVVGEAALSVLNKKPLIIDLASAPGGVDRSAAKEMGINVIWALSLPGKTAPKTAAKIIKDAVISVLNTPRSPEKN